MPSLLLIFNPDDIVDVVVEQRSLYRGLIFGDGAGLDNMGFAIEGRLQLWVSNAQG